jgi:hypothetical protein
MTKYCLPILIQILGNLLSKVLTFPLKAHCCKFISSKTTMNSTAFEEAKAASEELKADEA